MWNEKGEVFEWKTWDCGIELTVQKLPKPEKSGRRRMRTVGR